MEFPDEVPVDEMTMRKKEWELLGYDVEDDPNVFGEPSIRVYKPIKDHPQFLGIPRHRSWTSYSIVEGVWTRDTPDPEDKP